MSLMIGDMVDRRDYDDLSRNKNEIQNQYTQIVSELFPFAPIDAIDHREVMLEIKRLYEFEYNYRNNE